MKSKNEITVSLSERPTVTINEFCRLIGLGRSTVYKAAKAGDLKLSKYGKRTFIKREEVQRFVQSM